MDARWGERRRKDVAFVHLAGGISVGPPTDILIGLCWVDVSRDLLADVFV